jgi:isopentenyl-diphosphate delta-isomerase
MTTLPTVNAASEIENRKAEHLRVCLEEDVEFSEISSGLEKYRFNHCCLPELDRSDLNIGTSFLGKSLGAPLLISSMTGGTTLAHLYFRRS